MVELSQDVITELETFERLSNENGYSLKDGLSRYINYICLDMIKMNYGSEIPFITEEVWDVISRLVKVCKEKNYDIYSVLYRASGDLWDKQQTYSNKDFYPSKESIARLKRIRNGVIQRCTNPNNPNFPSYGGRGIIVCEQWKKDSKAFIEWACDNGYADYLTLDRINPYGNYEPSNCRWATTYTQANNKRETKKHKPKVFKFENNNYSVKMMARLRHLDVNTLLSNLKIKPPYWAVRYSENSKKTHNINFEKQLYDNMDARLQYVYDCLVRSCVANDVDIYDLLKSLLGDIEKSIKQERWI